MKLSILAVLAIALLSGCRSEIKTTLPPNFEIVCDVDAGLYAPALDGLVWDGVKHTSRQSAVDHAWWIFKRGHVSGEPKNHWKSCED